MNQPRKTYRRTISIPDGLGGEEFVQHRVAQFALVAAALTFGFWFFRALGAVVGLKADFGILLHPSFSYHFAGCVPYVLLWLVTRSGHRPKRFVQIAESSALVSSCVLLQRMGDQIPLVAGAALIVAFASSLGFTTRAVLVPSHARVTAGLGLLIGVPMCVTFYSRMVADPEYFEVMRVPIRELVDIDATTIEQFAAGATGGFALLWLSATAIGAIASHVIYGLRRTAEEAAQLGQYTLVSKIGEGGMGAVYRARHALLRRPTAVKLLLPQLAGATTIARFEREVQLTAELSHPNTVTVFDYGRTPDGIFYYAMELLDGANLETIVELDGPQPVARVVRIIHQVAGALSEAHGLGLIHRDIKPANIILCSRGGELDVAKVVDFGLVRPVTNTNDVNVTLANIVTGTPLYMSPEAITDPEGVDARSDLYSLGAVAYYLLTGTHVFPGATMVEVCSHHLHTAPESPSKRLGIDVDPGLARLILDCLAKSPKDRPKDAATIRSRLRTVHVPRVWSHEDAKEWWSKNETRIGERNADMSSERSGQTMAIDLRR